jgi:hypothetical protein
MESNPNYENKPTVGINFFLKVFLLDNAGRQEIGGQWMINEGGNKHNNFSDGVQIPIYVITFGIIGGYLRYLYDATAPKRRKELEEKINKMDSKNLRVEIRRFFVFEYLRSIALIFLSPILAVVVWFVLAQLGIQGQRQNAAGQTGIFVLSAVSFTIGLVTDEAIRYLINFIRDRLGMQKIDLINDQKNKDKKVDDKD